MDGFGNDGILVAEDGRRGGVAVVERVAAFVIVSVQDDRRLGVLQTLDQAFTEVFAEVVLLADAAVGEVREKGAINTNPRRFVQRDVREEDSSRVLVVIAAFAVVALVGKGVEKL